MKISLITVVYNAERYLEDCIRSVVAQTHPDLEYIIIDGGSTDGTLKIIEKYASHIHHLVSESDQGLYDAINKGIALSSGEVVGLIHADDVLASEEVLESVAALFKAEEELDGVYGDLNYVHPERLDIIRRWVSRPSLWKDLASGWMPAHPTLYLKKALFERYGNYALDMGSTADYDLILRYLYVQQIKTRYLPMLMVNMRTGGISNQSIGSRYHALKMDYKALKRNNVPKAWYVVALKKLSKLKQFKAQLFLR